MTQSDYLCLDIKSGCLYTSRHVHFLESIFLFAFPSPSLSEIYKQAPLATSNPPVIHIPTRPLVSVSLAAPPCLNPHQTTSSSDAQPPQPAASKTPPTLPNVHDDSSSESLLGPGMNSSNPISLFLLKPAKQNPTSQIR